MREPARIHVEAPDGPSALLLEHRLAHLRPTTIERYATWSVEILDDEDRLEEVVAAVRHWLRETGLAAAEVYVEGVLRVVAVETGEALPDYDGARVLVHEP